MHLKTVYVSALLMMLPILGSAQDKIYKNDGSTIDAKIKNIGPKTITYVRFDNQSGPEYTIFKRDVNKIIYQSGSEENVNSGRPVRNKDGDNGPKARYKPNLLTLAPVQFTDRGLGTGISYERALDPGGIVALYIPAILVFNLNSGTYYNPSTGLYENGRQDMMFYGMPGVKIYPTGNQGVVRYAIGPSIAFATGQRSDNVYNPSTGMTEYRTLSRSMLGMVINNSLNINPSQHLYVGIEFGFGFTYLNRTDGLNQGTTGIAQGGFKIGYRF